MIRLISVLILAAIAAAAQTPAPIITESKQTYTGVKNNLTKLAEKMPEENYGFKPVAEIRSFGQLMAHMADSQLRVCSAVNGEMKQGTAASKTSKADIVAALKDSFAECDRAWDATTDANMMQMVKFRNGERTRLGILTYNTGHEMEEYGYGAVYLRLKGIVPPSSEGR